MSWLSTITSRTPCCGRRVRLPLTAHVERERYDRRCAGCDAGWIIDRLTLQNTIGKRIDRLDWFCYRGTRIEREEQK